MWSFLEGLFIGCSRLSYVEPCLGVIFFLLVEILVAKITGYLWKITARLRLNIIVLNLRVVLFICRLQDLMRILRMFIVEPQSFVGNMKGKKISLENAQVYYRLLKAT